MSTTELSFHDLTGVKVDFRDDWLDITLTNKKGESIVLAIFPYGMDKSAFRSLVHALQTEFNPAPELELDGNPNALL